MTPCPSQNERTADTLIALQVLLTDVRFCHAFFQLSYLMEDMARAHTVHWYGLPNTARRPSGVVQDVLTQSLVCRNGEDIFMSLVARKVSPAWPQQHAPSSIAPAPRLTQMHACRSLARTTRSWTPCRSMCRS